MECDSQDRPKTDVLILETVALSSLYLSSLSLFLSLSFPLSLSLPLSLPCPSIRVCVCVCVCVVCVHVYSLASISLRCAARGTDSSLQTNMYPSIEPSICPHVIPLPTCSAARLPPPRMIQQRKERAWAALVNPIRRTRQKPAARAGHRVDSRHEWSNACGQTDLPMRSKVSGQIHLVKRT